MSETPGSETPKLPVSTLLMALSTPGILAQFGYSLAKRGLVPEPLVDSITSLINENFPLWALFVYPSFLVFGFCGIFKVMECANLSRWERLAKIVRFGLASAWAGAVLWSVLSLALFRAPRGHGPDMVGQEMSGFLIPLFVASLLSLGLAAVHGPQSPARFVPLVATVAMAFLEVVIYLGVVMP